MPNVNIIQGTGNTLAYDDGAGGDAFSTKGKRNQKITFNCVLGDYAIHFGERSPFSKASYSDVAGSPLTLTVRAKATTGTYKYSVTVFTGAGKPLTDDPEVLID